MCISPSNIYSETLESNPQTLPWHASSRLLHGPSSPPPSRTVFSRHTSSLSFNFLNMSCSFQTQGLCTDLWRCWKCPCLYLQWMNLSYPLDLSLIDTSSKKSAFSESMKMRSSCNYLWKFQFIFCSDFLTICNDIFHDHFISDYILYCIGS